MEEDTGTPLYKMRRALVHPGTGETVMVAASPTKSNVSFLRLEFNPAKLGPAGVAFMRERLFDIFFDEHPWKRIATHCSVTRIDIAVDLLGVDMANVLVTDYKPGSGAGKPLKRMFVVTPEGTLETVYLGTDPPKVRVYDKAQHLADEKMPSAYGTTPHVRIEMPIKPACPITKLDALGNPFEKLTVLSLSNPVEPPDGMHNWAFFLDCCRVRGPKAALALLPTDELRQAYQQALAAVEIPILKPEKAWAKWPAMLNASGLLPD